MGGVEFAPPGARLLCHEVWERCIARPHLADVEVASFGAAEHVTLDGLIEDRVARVELHTGVDDRDHPEALLVKSFEHAGRIGKPVGIPGENAIAVHVLDVEPYGIAWDVVVPMPLSKLLDSIL